MLPRTQQKQAEIRIAKAFHRRMGFDESQMLKAAIAPYALDDVFLAVGQLVDKPWPGIPAIAAACQEQHACRLAQSDLLAGPLQPNFREVGRQGVQKARAQLADARQTG